MWQVTTDMPDVMVIQQQQIKYNQIKHEAWFGNRIYSILITRNYR
jgi:hypothetical protein